MAAIACRRTAIMDQWGCTLDERMGAFEPDEHLTDLPWSPISFEYEDTAWQRFVACQLEPLNTPFFPVWTSWT